MRRMENKVAVITGGASGIGRAAAERLAAEGAKVSILDLDADHLREAEEEIRRSGGEVISYVVDTTQEKYLEGAMKDTAERWGAVDVLFANAGILGMVSPIEYFPGEEWARTLMTNVYGTFETVKQVIPYMKEKGGSITVTSSVSGSREFAQAGFTAYSTSKAAILSFAKMAALELAQYKIRVNAICPGSIETNIGALGKSDHMDEIKFPIKIPDDAIPLTGKSGSADQVANLLLFLASDEAKHITGTEVYIDGAESLIKG